MPDDRAAYDEQLAERLAALLVAEHRRRTCEPVQDESPTAVAAARARDDDQDVPASIHQQ